MRPSRLSLPIPLVLASAGLFACSSSSSPAAEDTSDSGGSESRDGATRADATLPAIDGSTPIATNDAEADVDHGGDADDATLPETDGSAATGTTDAGADAGDAVDAGQPGTVQVIVLSGRGVEKGVTVVFSDATGGVLATVVTNAQGSAEDDVVAGSQVTALLGTSDQPNLVTITGVKPGDVLKVIDHRYLGGSGTAEVKLKAFKEADASVTDYVLTTGGCGSDTEGPAVGTFDYGVSPGCTNAEGQFPVLAEAMSSAGSLAWESGKGTLMASDAGAVGPVDLTTTTWSTIYGSETIKLLHTDGLSAFTSFLELTTVDAVSNVPFGGTNYEPTFLDGGAAQTLYPIHPGFGAFNQAEADYGLPQAHGASVLAIADRTSATTAATPSATDTIDLDDGLPAITGATITASNPVRPAFAWTSAKPLTTTAATVVQAMWTDTIDDAGDVKNGVWTIIVPGTQMSVVAPLLPAASLFAPTKATTWPAGPALVSLNADAYPTYDAIRAAAALIGPGLNVSDTPLIPALPSNGRARATGFYAY